MPDLRIEWDATKNASNKRKHGVSFEEAETVFYDDWAILIEDDDPDEPEERFFALGDECRVEDSRRVPLLPGG